MGNYHANVASIEQSDHCTSKQIVKLIKSPFKTKSTKTNRDHFFLNYLHSKTNTDDGLNHSDPDPRRVVFVSVLGLYLTWKQCPPYMLYTALCVMPLKRQWIYSPSKYQHDEECNAISDLSPFSDMERTKEFIELLKWKDSQGLVSWMLDDYQHPPDATTQMVHPFWYDLNGKLTNLYDPITGANYEPLNLNVDTWREHKHGSNFVSIMNELYFLRMEYKGLEEIIYSSNPESLRLMSSFIAHEQNESLKTSLFDAFDADEDKDNWWISNDYDPYDLDDQ
eukprot:82570_1